jgi:hypothetical protein
MKKPIASLLVAALAAVPFTARTQERPPDPNIVIIFTCSEILLILGTIKICVCIDQITQPVPFPGDMSLPPPDYPVLNFPPPVWPWPPVPFTNYFPMPEPEAAMVAPANGMPQANLVGQGIMDTNGAAPMEFTNFLSATLVAGPDLDQMHDVCRISVWQSSIGRLLLVSRDGVPLWTNYAFVAPTGKATNAVALPEDLIDRTAPRQFYRLVNK